MWAFDRLGTDLFPHLTRADLIAKARLQQHQVDNITEAEKEISDKEKKIFSEASSMSIAGRQAEGEQHAQQSIPWETSCPVKGWLEEGHGHAYTLLQLHLLELESQNILPRNGDAGNSSPNTSSPNADSVPEDYVDGQHHQRDGVQLWGRIRTVVRKPQWGRMPTLDDVTQFLGNHYAEEPEHDQGHAEPVGGISAA